MKAFVFIHTDELILRFLSHGSFDALESEYDVTYIAARDSADHVVEAIRSRLTSRGKKVAWIPIYLGRERRWTELFDVSCIRYMDRSSSFRVRVDEYISKTAEDFADLEARAQPSRFEAEREAYEQAMGYHPDLLKLVYKERPDLFVLPSALTDRMTDDVLQLADALHMPTLMLVAGWDNLSSKGLLHHHPTMTAVWGEQSVEHAVGVQGLDPEHVSVIGAPHYEAFRDVSDLSVEEIRKEFGCPVDKPLILFAGTFRLFDEVEALMDIQRRIHSGDIPDCHILYRPHPLRHACDPWRTEASYYDYEWDRVTMDPASSETYKAMKGGEGSPIGDYMHRMEHLRKLYTSVDAVISPMSTVLLESMIFGLPILAIAFNDGKHSWSADKVGQMMHFKELYDVPDVLACRAQEELPACIRKLLEHSADKDCRQRLREATEYFVHQEGRSYGERVVDMAETMMSKTDRKPRYGRPRLRPGQTYQAPPPAEPSILSRIVNKAVGLIRS